VNDAKKSSPNDIDLPARARRRRRSIENAKLYESGDQFVSTIRVA
jgi:hypothetical protein